MVSDLNDLIRESANEKFDAYDDSNGSETEVASGGTMNHPWAVLLAWLLSITLLLFHFLQPLPKQHDVGVRSVETRLSVAIFHTAYEVENYRKTTGHLPDYLDSNWRISETIEYQRSSDGYEITGRLGEHELTFRDGDDAESLIWRARDGGLTP